MNPRLTLGKDLGRHLATGHPWIWADALAAGGPRPAVGTIVDVHDKAGRFVARGPFDPGSPIAVRVWTTDAAAQVDAALVRARLREALGARRSAGILADSNAVRLLHGEGDYCPGLVCDLYADTAVVRCDGDAARTLAPALVAALLTEVPAILGVPVQRIYERRTGKAARQESGERGAPLHGGQPPRRIEIHEGAARFPVDVVAGQKTGFFLDQRDNRRLVARHAAGADVLNCFSYTGGFSVACALAGARRVTSVDVARPALDAAREGFRISGLDPEAHAFVAEDCFEVLRRHAAAGTRHGVVILDPPSFAPSSKALPAALAAYTDLGALGLAVVEPGGILATASCSSHVTPEAFLTVLRDAAVRAGRRVRVLDVRGAGPDHPVVPGFPEGRYLKLLLAHVV